MIVKENPILTLENYQRISEIFKLINWGARQPMDIKASFDKSTFTCIIYQDDEIIGFGRTFDDGQFYASLCDVAIDPAYQGQGIGTVIVNNLKNRLKGYEFITLTAAPGKQGFYKKLQWQKQQSAFIWPKSDQQRDEHC